MNSDAHFTMLVPLALFGFVPIGLLVLGTMRRPLGMVVVFVAGWLLLPMASYKVAGFPPYWKATAVSLTALLGLGLFESRKLLQHRWLALDFPMIVWCLCPMATSLSNGLGPHDGLSTTFVQCISTGVPYLIGRVCFGTPSSLNDLARGIVVGGLLYVPMCIYEMVMSPQLHTMVYGFHQHSFAQTKRFGGYRPTVFMQHGTAVGLYMASAALLAYAFWLSRRRLRVAGLPVGWIVCTLLLTAVFCKSLGAVALLAVGLVVTSAVRWSGSRILLWLLILVVPAYILTRTTGAWNGDSIVSAARAIDGDRSDSLACRIASEDVLVRRALEQPLLGWGGFNRSMQTNEDGDAQAIFDGMWVIVFGRFGLVGLAAMTITMLLPMWLLFGRVTRKLLGEPEFVPILAMAVATVLFMIDCLFNAAPNPMYLVIVGSTVTMLAKWKSPRAQSHRIREVAHGTSGRQGRTLGEAPRT